MVEWQKYKDIGKLIAKLKENRSPKGERFSVAAVEQSPNSINYKKFKPRYPLTLIFGNEVRGLSKQILKKCDSIIEIPVRDKKESLNVSIVAGIILFEFI